MKTEIFIARRLQLKANNGDQKSSPSLAIATIGIVLAITVMILSLTIVSGFKSEISNKIYALDSHIKVSNASVNEAAGVSTVDISDVLPVIQSSVTDIKSVSLIAEQPVIIKTESDFKGIAFKGVDANYDWSTISQALTDGNVPRNDAVNEVVISQKTANLLNLKVGDSFYAYHIADKIKTRKCTISGIFCTNFDEFDSNYVLGNIAFVQRLNKWKDSEGCYVSIDMNNVNDILLASNDIYTALARACFIDRSSDTAYNVTNTLNNNASFFSWLDLLDMNVVIIIILMAAVSAFTLISVLLMIVLERIKMVGLLKTLGASNQSIRHIFIYLTHKIILKSVVYGNIIGIGLSVLQNMFHIVKLNPEAYYMPYVPIEIDVVTLIVLNVCILAISYLTLLGPSHIISSIKPTTTMRFE